jgi:peptidoglycan/LPS O-acetylase OafA/YrhL
LSGYLITQSSERSRTTWSFLKKRIRRIYPGYLIAAAVCVWIVVPIASPNALEVFSPRSIARTLWQFATLDALRVPPTFIDNPYPHAVNGSLWSIRYEFWCYIGVMFLGAVGMLLRRVRLAILLVGLMAIHLVFEWYDLNPKGSFLTGLVGVPRVRVDRLAGLVGVPRVWVRLLPLYLSGVVAYLYRDRTRLSFKGAAIALVGLSIAARLPHGMVLAIPTLATYLLL